MNYALRPLAFAVALGSTAVHAAPSGESTITLGEISVVGNANKSAMAGSSRVLTSVDVLGAAAAALQLCGARLASSTAL